MLLVGGLSLPFDNETTTLLKKFVSSAVGKIYKLLTEKLPELEAPWQYMPPYDVIKAKIANLSFDLKNSLASLQ